VSADMDGFDMDGGTLYSVMQYNYSHDNYGAGFLLSDAIANAGPTIHNVVRYNVSQNDARRDGYGGITVGFVDPTYPSNYIGESEIYNNTIYMTPNTAGTPQGAITLQDGDVVHDLYIRNNIFMVSGGVPAVRATFSGIAGTAVMFQGNDYYSNGAPLTFVWNGQNYTGMDGSTGWRTATGQEKVGSTLIGLTVDPKLINPGQGGTLNDPNDMGQDLTAYGLQAGSPVATAGLNLSSFGVTWDPYNFAGDSFVKAYFNTTPTDLLGHNLTGRHTFSMGVDQEGN
jgi:hypothetical protein